MQILRTPDSAFADIAAYPFVPHYAHITDPQDGTRLRLHYVDEGRYGCHLHRKDNPLVQRPLNPSAPPPAPSWAKLTKLTPRNDAL